VTPADHRIEPAQEFRRAVQVAVQLAEESPRSLVTLGISPTYPATGYGYIQRGPELARRQGIRVFRVQRFREKPDAASAAQMIATGEYFWNAGIFVWKAATILECLKENQPAIHAGIERIADAWATPQRDRVFEREYQALPRLSIDFAVMEKAKDVLVVEAPFQWDDVGSWLAVERMSPQDAEGNTILARHCGLRTQNCIIVGDAARLITTVGVENLIIIQDGDAILVANRKDEGNIKQLVELLKKNGMDAHL
jgi:mannose-1-phosphate guanylyltransferase